jgi:hypothetical protein
MRMGARVRKEDEDGGEEGEFVLQGDHGIGPTPKNF